MTTYIINIICAAISTILFIKAPHQYNYEYCLVLMLCFLAQNGIYFLTNKRKHWLGFELIFAISFFFVNFVYPVFYYPTRPLFSFFAMRFNHDVITRATALAYFGYTWYLLGATRLFRLHRIEPEQPQFEIGFNQYICFFGITLVSFLLYVATGGLTALQSVYHGGGNLRDVGIYSYFNNIFTIGCYLMAIFIFRLKRQKWWFYLSILIGFILIILSTGSRQLAIGLVLVLLASFSLYVYRFRWWQVLLILIGGAAVLFVIVQVRKAGVSWSSISALHPNPDNILDIFTDLIINNLNLFVLVDYADNHPLTYLQGMLLDLSSPIPGLGSYIISVSDLPRELLHGGDLPSYILLGPNATWGTGTNMVGEAYRSFGLVGTALSMFLIGFIIKESFYRAHQNIYWYLIYFLFVSHALIYPRAPLLFDPRLVVWSILILCIVLQITSNIPRIAHKLNSFSRNRKEVTP